MGPLKKRKELFSGTIKSLMSDAVLRTEPLIGWLSRGSEEGIKRETLVVFLKEVQFDSLGVFPLFAGKGQGRAAYKLSSPDAKATKLKRPWDEIMGLAAEDLTTSNGNMGATSVKTMEGLVGPVTIKRRIIHGPPATGDCARPDYWMGEFIFSSQKSP